MQTLEHHYRDLCDIEFTVENGKLWMLQTRVGKRSAAAAFRIATQLVDEGVISMDEALGRVSGGGLAELMFPRFDQSAAKPLVTGMGASPGAAVGKVVFDSATAVSWAAKGEAVVLVRTETNPDDLPGMVAAKGILTRRGGKTSHAAVVARGMGKTCVVAAQDIVIDAKARHFACPDGTVVPEGDVISIDGKTGAVYRGAMPVMASPLVKFFEGAFDPASADAETGELVRSVQRMLEHADARRRLSVRANADMPDDARRARAFGAGGIGLCRTEHMFLGERRSLVERLILAGHDDVERQAALDALLPLQRADFVAILKEMDGLPVTIRLIDPPLHEFLTDLTELSVTAAVARATGHPDEHAERLLPAVRRLHEANPMLGLRGVRLCLAIPGLVQLQVRAIAEAAAQRRKQGGDPRVEIMVPVVGAVQEFEHVREQAEAVIDAVAAETGVVLEKVIGTMIELPRACLTAGDIAEAADFFSFGTNDLTQTTWGFSRDDCEASFFPLYMEMGIFGTSPFETLDQQGVGALVRMASATARTVKPGIELGVCGEHGGDPESIHFFNDIGLDYVSCSPFRVPVARLEAGRAALPKTVAGGVAASR
jgi:pyruvate,orthophosphate dikinase